MKQRVWVWVYQMLCRKIFNPFLVDNTNEDNSDYENEYPFIHIKTVQEKDFKYILNSINTFIVILCVFLCGIAV